MRFIVALLALLASDAAMAQQQTFKDANGRTLGRSVTDSRGNTTFYDSAGRNTGRAVTDSRGNTTFYDAMGRNTGRAHHERQHDDHLRQLRSSHGQHQQVMVIASRRDTSSFDSSQISWTRPSARETRIQPSA